MLAPVSGEFPTIKTPQRDIAKRLKTEEENNSVFDSQPAEVQRHSCYMPDQSPTHPGRTPAAHNRSEPTIPAFRPLVSPAAPL